MTLKVSHLVGGIIVLALIVGGAFSLGTRWDSTSEVNTASASTALDSIDETSSEDPAERSQVEGELYSVIKVVDGDTIAVSMDGKSETVRLIGIDTPETVDTRTDVQCFGREASERARELLNGTRVRLVADAGEGERDKYHRLLAYVFREDGTHINKLMIEEGYAHEYTYDGVYDYQKEFKAAEASAKAGEHGLWSPNVCPTPVKATKPAAVKKVETAPAPTPVQTPEAAEPAPVQTIQPTSEPKPHVQEEQSPAPTPQSSSSYTCSSNKYNCTDFTTHAEAQAVFDQCGGASNDVHKLDNNKDGEACESLP